MLETQFDFISLLLRQYINGLEYEVEIQNTPEHLTKKIYIAPLHHCGNSFDRQGKMKQMKKVGSIFGAIIMLTLVGCCLAIIEESDRELVAANFPYGRGVDSDQLQLARILLFPQRICHAKRNSELINSLLGLPKNMNNAGK